MEALAAAFVRAVGAFHALVSQPLQAAPVSGEREMSANFPDVLSLQPHLYPCLEMFELMAAFCLLTPFCISPNPGFLSTASSYLS